MRNELLLAGLLGIASVTGCAKPIPQPISLEQTVAKINYDAERKITHYNEIKPLIEDVIYHFFGREGLNKIRKYEIEIVPEKEFERIYPTIDNIEKLGTLDESKKRAKIKSGPTYQVIATVSHEFGHVLTKQDDVLPCNDALKSLQDIPQINGREFKKEYFSKMIRIFRAEQKAISYMMEMHKRENLEIKLMEEAGAMAVERMVGEYLIDKYTMEVMLPREVNHPDLHSVAACIVYDLGDYLSLKHPNKNPDKQLKRIWEITDNAHYGEIEELLKSSTKKMAEKFFEINGKK